MADEQVPEQREPTEVERFAAQLRQDLGGAFNQLGQRLNQIEQRVAQPREPQKQAPQIQVPDNINDQLREKIIGDPLSFVKETVGVATQQAEARAREIIATERAQQAAGAAYSNFWNTFAQHNQDVAHVAAQVEVNLRNMGVDPFAMMNQGRYEELSRAADQAANQIRGVAAQRAEAEKQAAARQKQGLRAAAGSPGRGSYPADMGDAPEPERRDPRAELQADVDELKAQRQKKMWNQIDTPEYRASAHDRETKVRQDKYIAGGRR